MMLLGNRQFETIFIQSKFIELNIIEQTESEKQTLKAVCQTKNPKWMFIACNKYINKLKFIQHILKAKKKLVGYGLIQSMHIHTYKHRNGYQIVNNGQAF